MIAKESINAQEVREQVLEISEEHLPFEAAGYECTTEMVYDVLLKAATEGISIEAACQQLEDVVDGNTIRSVLNEQLEIEQIREHEQQINGALASVLPEQYGLQPDGDSPALPEAQANQSSIGEEDWTLAEARRTGAFWVFAAALATTAMVTAGLVFHQTSIFEAQGLGRNAAVRVFQMIALTSVGGNLAMGRLLDQYSARYILAGLLALLSTTIVLVQVMVLPIHGLFYGILMGLCSGSFRVIDNVIWAKYFGRRYLGSIRGVTMFGAIGGTALGAYPLGLSVDHFGSYSPALNGLLAIACAIVLCAFFVKRPQKQQLS